MQFPASLQDAFVKNHNPLGLKSGALSLGAFSTPNCT